MTVESASYISQLNTAWPLAADLISEGDDHIRLAKTVLKTQFPNFGTTAIAASAAEVNYSVGVTSAIQTQLNSKAPTVSPTFTGTAVLPATTSIGTVSDVEIATLDGVTSSIQTQINDKGAIAGQAWTGAHSFAGATSVPTLSAGTNTTGAASTAFVQADFLQKFPNYTAPVNASTAELNYLVGLTGAIQPQLSNQVSGPIHAATSKSTPVDADELGITDSAASWSLKKLTFANLKAWIGALFVSKSGDTMTGDLNFSGAGRRITGDFSNATLQSRAMFQTTTSNAVTSVAALPSGSGAGSNFSAYSASDASNSSRAQIAVVPGVSVNLSSDSTGTGSYLPLCSYVASIKNTEQPVSGGFLVTGGVLGYGVGSGGTVVQATSRSTTVTLNKQSGSITLFSAAGTTTWNSFAVINSTVSLVDAVVLSVRGGNNAYICSVDSVGAGSFRILFSAISGTATDTPTINYEVIKGANS